MDTKKQKKISRFMSLVLRHQPDAAGLTLDEGGWVSVSDLLNGLSANGRGISMQQLEVVVAENDKQRFQFDEDKVRIRATQGHSVVVELGYEPAVPPEFLYHGTPKQFVASIRREGLKKQRRHHVHLHLDVTIARAAGERRGDPVILTVASGRMHASGHQFFLTPNNVWLTDAVPPEYLLYDETNA